MRTGKYYAPNSFGVKQIADVTALALFLGAKTINKYDYQVTDNNQLILSTYTNLLTNFSTELDFKSIPIPLRTSPEFAVALDHLSNLRLEADSGAQTPRNKTQNLSSMIETILSTLKTMPKEEMIAFATQIGVPNPTSTSTVAIEIKNHLLTIMSQRQAAMKTLSAEIKLSILAQQDNFILGDYSYTLDQLIQEHPLVALNNRFHFRGADQAINVPFIGRIKFVNNSLLTNKINESLLRRKDTMAHIAVISANPLVIEYMLHNQFLQDKAYAAPEQKQQLIDRYYVPAIKNNYETYHGKFSVLAGAGDQDIGANNALIQKAIADISKTIMEQILTAP